MCPRTKEQNDALREKRKLQIIRAAADMLLERGLAIEIRDVALKAGLGYGTVYHYYKNKHELLDDLLWHAFGAAQEAVEAELSPGMNRSSATKDKLERYCIRLLRLWLQDPSVFFLYKSVAENGISIPGGGRMPHQLAERFDAELYQPLAEAIHHLRQHNPAKDADHEAHYVLGALIGCAGLHIHRHQMEMDVEGTVNLLLAAFQQKEGA
ncbi:TetR/AcrR family transcriptional regulator [Paenibacillus mendelii]|uniref:TetR/AcrR family transcriptional regulator n=1 Tax=Paenibacillus mendelii TaxID=206163 RepID=A0ABV6J8D7_9BACL|nr:TetR/AcrR family transcriptional regulator [Paenibacillus mendelii]MCQ6559481.1 TetR/AcrR family transcriptional regulator [Paenibacillus mendelii]